MTPDESLRERLSALAQAEELPELSATARARVEVRALAQLKRQEERRTRLFGWGMAFAAAGALAVVDFLLLPVLETPPTETADSEPSVEPMKRAEPVGPDCIEHRDSAWRRDVDGRQVLDLKSRALVVASAEAQVSHVFSASCDLRTDLSSGVVAVHARDLRGGELVVHTPSGDVTVRGTIFEVAFDPGREELRVSVDEGLVQVTPSTGEVLEVRPGQSVVLGKGITREPLGKLARHALRRRVGLGHADSPSHARSESGPSLTSDAAVHEILPTDDARSWHSGNVEPPAIAPEPGTSITDEGRPMQKPRVIEAP